jgi:hypothetical protein
MSQVVSPLSRTVEFLRELRLNCAEATLPGTFTLAAPPASRKPQNFNAMFTNRQEVRLASAPRAAILTIAG